MNNSHLQCFKRKCVGVQHTERLYHRNWALEYVFHVKQKPPKEAFCLYSIRVAVITKTYPCTFRIKCQNMFMNFES